MTIEYVLLMIAVFAIGLKTFTSAPMDAFKKAGPALGARVEKQLSTGSGFKPQGTTLAWDSDK
jgi:hypothetical protein